MTTAKIADSNVTGAKIASYRIPYQTDNSDSITNATGTTNIIQSGWGQIEGDASDSISTTVTFPAAFTTILSVHITLLGQKSSVAADITGFDTSMVAASTGYNAGARSITTTTMAIHLHRSSGLFASGTYYGFSWIAIGL